SLPRFGGVHRRIDDSALFGSLTVIQKEEEGFVLDNRSAEPSAKLIAIRIRRLHTIEVVEPSIRIESRVVVCIKHTSAKLVRAASSRNLNLSTAAAGFCIGRRDEDSDFRDEVRTELRRGVNAGLIPAIVDTHAIHHRLNGARPAARKTCCLI